MKNLLKYLTLMSCLAFIISCNPVRYLNKEIKQLGYIKYTTPLEFAGPGTLIGGGPKQLSIVAGPETCFPKSIDDVPTELLSIDNTTIPSRQWKITTHGNINLELINFLASGNSMLGAGVGFSKVQTMSLTMNGVHVEYLDSIKLTHFYTYQMDSVCQEYLDRVGFIIQALKVDNLEFTFYDETGASIDLSIDNIEEILEISFDIKFSIVDGTKLIIETPKYIGYQLGRLQKSDKGLALYRATKTRGNKFIFKNLDIFNGGGDNNTIEKRIIDDSLKSFSDFNFFQELDYHSVYE